MAGQRARLRRGAPGRAHPEQPRRGGRPPCPAPLRRARRRPAPSPRQGGDARRRRRALPQGGSQLQTRAVRLLRDTRPATHQQRPRASVRRAALPRAPGQRAQGGLPGHCAPWGGAPDRGHGDAAAPTRRARVGSGQPRAMDRTPPASRRPAAGPDPAHPLPPQPGCLPGRLGTASVPASFAGLEKKSLRASEQDRPDVARHRSRWRVWQRYMDGERFVFIDETAATTAMTRLSGWGPRGERLVDAAPAGHWKTTTVVAGLRSTGVVAPLVLDGPMTGTVFRTYVEQVLAPALEPGDIVAMDNLAVHKVAGVKEAIRAAGASVLYLPSYSPDFNPIEQFFAKLKALLRKAAARTQNALWETIGTSLDDFTPAECQNYIVNSGYEFV